MMNKKGTSVEDDITVAELMAIVQKWIRFLFSKYKILIPAGLIGGALGIGISLLQTKQYNAELSFALEEKQSSIGSYAALASQFGLDLGGGGGGAFAGDNLVELLKTRLMVERTLLNPVVIDGDTDLLLNRYIKFFKIDEEWENNPEMEGFAYKRGVPRKQYTIKQDSILDRIQERVRKEMLSVKRVDKKLNLVIVNVVSPDQIFAKLFAEELVATTSYYYIEGKTKKARTNIATIENKIDSVRKELNSRLYGAAEEQDRDLNVIRAQKRVSLAQKQIDIQLLTTVYAELSKNIEMAKYTLSREEPLVHIIDTPVLPLRYEKLGKFMGMLIFGILTGLITAAYLVIKEYVAEQKQKDESN